MSEFRISTRPALAGMAEIHRNGVSLEALPEGTVLHLLSRSSETASDGLGADTAAAGLSLRAAAPGQWFAVGDAVLPQAQIKSLAAMLKPKVDIVDQSHGRVRILLDGPMATRVLAKATAVDLSLATFPVGHASTTLIGHITAHVTRIDADGFELIVLRGFAESLWDDLARMSLEFS